jgi:hypothetical protein
MKCLSGWRNDDFVGDPSGYRSSPTLTGGIQSSLCSFREYRSFKLGEDGNKLHYHGSRNSCCIDSFRQAPESGFSFLNPLHNHQDVADRARNSVQSAANDYVPLPQLIQKAV